ncbi:hypothetical protein ACF07Q_28680 [Nocardiopsis dassonvillei]|uniref:hypothetical protein n=1 Tax=Nocardiopsis dassonvillei TaxID=2014 RepID=UPI0037019E6F
MKHTDARATLAQIDATLRIADRGDQLWQDPAFLAWEAGQVGDITHVVDDSTTVVTRYTPGPKHWTESIDAHLAWIDITDTVTAAPMVDLFVDHSCDCDSRGGEYPDMSNPMRMTAADYPPLEHTTYGPVLLDSRP